jgi:mannitol/fructose-specific phosphotransferase system IIA component (Ntr-type)
MWFVLEVSRRGCNLPLSREDLEMVIAELPSVAGIPLDIVELRLKRRDSAWTQMVVAAHAAGAVTEPDVVLAALAHRERLGSTGIGKGCVLAGIRSLAVVRPHIVLGRTSRGIEWGAADEAPVTLAVLLLSPATQGADAHLDQLARLSQALRLQRSRHKLAEAPLALAAVLLEGRTG